MPKTSAQASDNASEDGLEEKPIVVSAAMRASLAKFSFSGVGATPPKSQSARATPSRPAQHSTPSRGVKRKLSELSLADNSRTPPQTPTPKSGKPNSSSRKGTPTSRKKNPGYAPPETYAHLNYLEDHIKPNLDILFSPELGQQQSDITLPIRPTSFIGHSTRLTDTLLNPSEDWSMPERYNLGLTNMVDRPSSTASELSRAEKVAGVPTFLTKVARYRPRIVCFIGREIGDAFETAVRKSLKISGSASTGKTTTTKRHPTNSELPAAKRDSEDSAASKDRKAADYVTPLLATPGYGLLPYKLVYAPTGLSHERNQTVSETLFFTAPSTSGRVQTYQLEDRVQLFRVLGMEKEAVLSGSSDTTEMITIPSKLYNVAEARTEQQSDTHRGTPETR
ncbi:hypothetical protein FRC05_000822 [Tulasnella sp. 425]|nr:hypothetical protein FRC05_000822 [Tulasnella sp. 425]